LPVYFWFSFFSSPLIDCTHTTLICKAAAHFRSLTSQSLCASTLVSVPFIHSETQPLLHRTPASYKLKLPSGNTNCPCGNITIHSACPGSSITTKGTQWKRPPL
jgi:hypothetical protein